MGKFLLLANLSQVQDLALRPVDSHSVGLSPWIQSAQISLQSLPALQQILTTVLSMNLLIQIISRGTEPRDIPQVTVLQLDVAPFTLLCHHL